MKKMLLSSVLGLAALAMWAAPSHAWTFGLIPYHCWPCGGKCGKCGRCCSTICIQPYNAFSPVACGSMCFDGCNPFCCPNNPGYPGPGYPGPGYPGAVPPPGSGYNNLPPADAYPAAPDASAAPCGPSDSPCAPSAAPCAPSEAPCAPPTAPTPGMSLSPMPYGGPLQAAGLYGAPMPMPAQPYNGPLGR